MNGRDDGARVENLRWGVRRWLYVIAVVFLAQIAVIFLMAERPPPAQRHREFGAAIEVALDAPSQESLRQLPGLSDPTLFALPNLRGFSGAAWLTLAPLEHQFNDWTQSQRWLEPETLSLGKTFLDFASTNTIAPLAISDKPLPASPGDVSLLPSISMPTRSEIRLEGDLVGRKLLNPPNLPAWPHSNILAKTEVQLLVDIDGDTQFSTLLTSSGLSGADQLALKVAGRARFQSQRNPGETGNSNEGLSWGSMIFQWHTVPSEPTSTNTFGQSNN